MSATTSFRKLAASTSTLAPRIAGNQVVPPKPQLYHIDAFDWLASAPPASIHAVVTDPPYGAVEYTPE